MLLQPLFFLIFYFFLDSRKTSEIETEKNYLLKMLFYIKSQLFFTIHIRSDQNRDLMINRDFDYVKDHLKRRSL